MRLFTRDRDFYKTFVILALPIALQNFIAYAVNFADNIMIGRLGKYAISGVYMGNQPQTLLQFAITGITGSLAVLGAQYWGKKDTDSICRLTGLATKIALLIGVIMAVVAYIIPGPILRLFSSDAQVVADGAEYLKIVCWSYIFFAISQVLMSAMQSVETVRIGLYMSIITLFVNVTLNYLLIFGVGPIPAMGIRGAALATVISRAVEALVMLVYVLKIDKKLDFKGRDFFRKGGDLLRDLIFYGTPIFGANVVWGINNIAQGAIVGHLSAEATASASIAGNLNMLLFMIVIGFSIAISIIIGKTVGAGLVEKVKEYAITAEIIFAITGVVMGALLYLLKNPFLSLYNLEPATITVANQFLIILAITLVGKCYQAPSFGIVKAGGETSFQLKLDAFFVFIVVLPSALIAHYLFHAPAWVVYTCLQCDQILKCFVAIVKVNRFNWIKNLTRV